MLENVSIIRFLKKPGPSLHHDDNIFMYTMWDKLNIKGVGLTYTFLSCRLLIYVYAIIPSINTFTWFKPQRINKVFCLLNFYYKRMVGYKFFLNEIS